MKHAPYRWIERKLAALDRPTGADRADFEADVDEVRRRVRQYCESYRAGILISTSAPEPRVMDRPTMWRLVTDGIQHELGDDPPGP